MQTKNKILSIVTAVSFGLCTSNVFAEEATTTLSETETTTITTESTESKFMVDKTTENSATLSWPEVEGSIWYIVYYSTEEVTPESENYKSTEDIITETTTTISDLEYNVEYYFYLTSIDENGVESEKSEPVKVVALSDVEAIETTDITDTTIEESFGLKDVVAPNTTEILVSFNKDLNASDDAIREFKVENENGEEVAIKEVLLENSNTVALILDTELTASTSYKVVTIAIQDIDGKNIEAGVDGILTFMTPEILQPKADISDTTEVIEETTTVEEVKEEVVEETPTAEEIASDPKVLPTTGAKEIFVLALALILSYAVFARRKTA